MDGRVVTYNRDMNLVFGTCVDIQTTARALAGMTFDMELLARNGVVHAAKIPAGQGRSLLVLAEFLTELPSRIRPETQELEKLCDRLTHNTANCSNLARLYYQQVRTLASIQHSAADDPVDGRPRAPRFDLSEARYPIDEDLKELAAHVPGGADVHDRRRGDVVDSLLVRGSHNLRRMETLLAESERALDRVFDKLAEIGQIGATAKYLAQYVAIESVQIDTNRDSFSNLAATIRQTIEELDETLAKIRHVTREGQRLLAQLRQEVHRA